MNDKDNRRRPGSRAPGAGRRTYPGAAGPRVGRVARDVPKAQHVTGEEDASRSEETYRGNTSRPKSSSNSSLLTPHSSLHRGAAYRAPSGPRRRDADAPIAEAPEDEHLLAGRNPIREALRAGRPVEKLLVASGELSGAAQEIVRMARDAGAVVQPVDRSRLDQIYPAHQGMLAYVAAVPYVSLEDILASVRAKGEEPIALFMNCRSISAVIWKSAITPSLIGRTAVMEPGVRPIIILASSPTATTFGCPAPTATATTLGSRITMPLFFTQISVFAVPRSIPIS